jgi:hypothetical protein
MSFTPPEIPTQPIVIQEAHLRHLIDERAKHAAVREAAETKVKALNARVLECLTAAGVKRHQMRDGTIVQIVQPKDREVIKPETLLKLNVSPEIIKAATDLIPVKAFPRIDAPAGGVKPEVDATEAEQAEAPTPGGVM